MYVFMHRPIKLPRPCGCRGHVPGAHVGTVSVPVYWPSDRANVALRMLVALSFRTSLLLAPGFKVNRHGFGTLPRMPRIPGFVGQ